jgi:hypothetical protein
MAVISFIIQAAGLMLAAAFSNGTTKEVLLKGKAIDLLVLTS